LKSTYATCDFVSALHEPRKQANHREVSENGQQNTSPSKQNWWTNVKYQSVISEIKGQD